MPESIHYLTGDATDPQGAGGKIIIHICNDVGGWAKGFVLALSKRWKQPEESYRSWYASQEYFQLGVVQFVPVFDEEDEEAEELWVANMIAQHDIIADQHGNPPLRLDALEKCLRQVAGFAQDHALSVHLPRIGTGLAGGKWEDIEPLLQQYLSDAGIPTYVYDLP